MALNSSIGVNETPENAVPRDFTADTEAAIKARIAEYKDHDRDSSYLEAKLQRLVNAKKGRRRAGDSDQVEDRADSTDGTTAQEQERLKREKGKVEPKGQGVPDQKSDKSSDPEAQAGAPQDVPDQKSPWPAEKPQPAIHQPPLPKSGEGSSPAKGSAKR
jgi:hypothetical protein